MTDIFIALFAMVAEKNIVVIVAVVGSAGLVADAARCAAPLAKDTAFLPFTQTKS